MMRRYIYFVTLIAAMIFILLSPAAATPVSASFSMSFSDILKDAEDLFNFLFPVFGPVIGIVLAFLVITWVFVKIRGMLSFGFLGVGSGRIKQSDGGGKMSKKNRERLYEGIAVPKYRVGKEKRGAKRKTVMGPRIVGSTWVGGSSKGMSNAEWSDYKKRYAKANPGGDKKQWEAEFGRRKKK